MPLVFFGSLQVFTEQCRRLGIFLDHDTAIGLSSPLSPKSNDTDHMKHVLDNKAWKRFDMTFEEFKKSTILSPVSHLAELFLISGDIHATLYTGSKAMHSHILSILSRKGQTIFRCTKCENNITKKI